MTEAGQVARSSFFCLSVAGPPNSFVDAALRENAKRQSCYAPPLLATCAALFSSYRLFVRVAV